MSVIASHDWTGDGSSGTLGGIFSEAIHGLQVVAGAPGYVTPVVLDDTTYQFDYDSTNSYPDAQYGEVRVQTQSGSGAAVVFQGPSLRHNGAGGGNFYSAEVRDSSAGVSWIYYWTAGAFTNVVGASFTTALAVGDWIHFEVNTAFDFTIKVSTDNRATWTTIASITDAGAHYQSGKVGLGMLGASGNIPKITNWESGDLGAPVVTPDTYIQEITGARSLHRTKAAFRARSVYASTLQRQDLDGEVNAPAYQYPDMGVTGVYLPREPIAARQAWLQFMFGAAQDLSSPETPPQTYTQPVIGVHGLARGRTAWIRALRATEYGWVPAKDVPVLVVTPDTYQPEIAGVLSLRWNLQRKWLNAQIATRYGWQVEVPPVEVPPPFVGIDPVIMLQISRDGGHTWEAPIAAPLGATGKYDDVNRPAWFQLGRVRADKFVVKEVITDPVRRVLGPGLWVRATPGTGQN